MGRVATVVAVLAIVGAAFYFAMFRGAGGEAPGVAEALSAEHTAGVAGVQRLDEIARRADEAVRSVPKEMLGDAGAMLDPAKRNEALGFDPLKAAGWAELGVDPEAGVHVALDGRIAAAGKPVPILLLRVTDQAKLLAFIEKRSGQKPEVSGDGAVKTVKLAGKTAWFGVRAGFTAILLGDEALAGGGAKKGFEAYLTAAGGSLSGIAPFKAGFGGAKDPVFFGYGDLKGARSLAAELKAPPQALAVIDYYIGLFPGVAGWLGLETTGFRLVASEKGAALLRKFFRPQRSAPELAKYIPAKGWGAVKLSANLPQLLDALAEALPPDLPQAAEIKRGIQAGVLAMGLVVGVTWDQIGKAFSGHVAFAADLSSIEKIAQGGGFDAVALIGVSDPAQADTVVKILLEKAKQAIPIPIVVKRDGDVLVVGLAASVDAAIARAAGKDTLKGTDTASALGDDVVYGATYDITPLLAQVAKEAPELQAMLNAPAMQKMKANPHVAFALRLDRDGLVGESIGSAASLNTMMGAMAAVAIPAFVKYINRAKTAEVRQNLRRMTDGAVAFYEREQLGDTGELLPKRFPASASLTPADPCRKSRKPEPIPAEAWTAKGWQELRFQVEDPSYFSYEFVSSGEGSGAIFTARAHGDLDCDGTRSTFERVGRVGPDGSVDNASATYTENETE